jgi:hypothetical protein
MYPGAADPGDEIMFSGAALPLEPSLELARVYQADLANTRPVSGIVLISV